MPEKPEVRIVLKALPDGRTEIGMWEPEAMRPHWWGCRAYPWELDAAVRNLKTTLERQGNRVSVVTYKG